MSRGLIALTTVVALLVVSPTTTASADTITSGDRVCSMYVNSVGFGAFCSSGEANFSGIAPPTWKKRLGNNVFIPCRDFPIPDGIHLGPPPDGKTWVLRVTIEDYDLNRVDGGAKVHLERAIVPVGPEERDQCPTEGYMNAFWKEFGSTYPDPALQVRPTYVPRVNVPTYFSLTRETSAILKNNPNVGPVDSAQYNQSYNLTMRGLVTQMKVDPGDGTPPFICAMGVAKAGDDGYDETNDPFHQMSTCKHTYIRSSAHQPDGMYTVKLTITWTVDYWKGGPDWPKVGTAEVNAVQRLPVQEVEAIGG